jgi:hypothetical protein
VRSADTHEQSADEHVHIGSRSVLVAKSTLESLRVGHGDGRQTLRADVPRGRNGPSTAGLGGWNESAHAKWSGASTHTTLVRFIAIVIVVDVVDVRTALSEDLKVELVVLGHVRNPLRIRLSSALTSADERASSRHVRTFDGVAT